MEIIIFSLFLLIGLFLLIYGNTVKDFIYIFGASVIIMIIGMSLFAYGIDISNGSVSTLEYDFVNLSSSDLETQYNAIVDALPINASFLLEVSDAQVEVTLITEETQYKTVNNIFTHGVGLILLLFGIYIMVICWDLYSYKRKEDEKNGR